MKYLDYTCYRRGACGLSNMVMSIEIGVVMAFLTKRVLVLSGNRSPPANIVPYPNVLSNRHRSRVTDLVDLPVPWIDADLIDLEDLDSHDLSNEMLGETVFCHPADIDIGSDDFRSFAGRRTHLLTYSERARRSAVLRMPGGREARNNLTFYSYFFYLDQTTRASVHQLLRRMAPKPALAGLASRIVDDLGPFNAVHVRRGDFKSTIATSVLERTPRELVDALVPHFDRDEKLVILTDDRHDSFLDELRKQYADHVILDDFVLERYREEFLDLPQHDSLALAFLSQLIAADSKDFVGSMKSTFSALIQRSRGNRGRDEPFKFLWNEVADDGAELKRGRTAVSTCVPMRDGLMLEERAGPYSWNRYNPRINPSWMREWPESFLTSTPQTGDAPALPGPCGNGAKPRRGASSRSAVYVGFGEDQVAVITSEEVVLAGMATRFGAGLARSPRRVVGQVEVGPDRESDRRYRVTVMGGGSVTTADGKLIPTVLWTIAKVFVEARRDLFWLRGSILRQSDEHFGFVAAPHHRKFLSILRERGWRSVIDDFVPIDSTRGVLSPFPQLSADEPEESGGPANITLSMLIFPAHHASRPTEITSLSPASAVTSLMENCVNFHLHRDHALETMCELVQTMPMFHMTVGNESEAADLVIGAHLTRLRDARILHDTEGG